MTISFRIENVSALEKNLLETVGDANNVRHVLQVLREAVEALSEDLIENNGDSFSPASGKRVELTGSENVTSVKKSAPRFAIRI